MLEDDAYNADEDQPLIKMRYKKRLLVGEGNFSFAKALISKHQTDKPGLAQAITATELQKESALEQTYHNDIESNFQNNIQYLKEQGAEILFEVDATQLHQKFKQQRYKRIHFNCPFAGSGEATSELVAHFFQSAKEIQKENDRIHITLKDNNMGWQLGRTYNLLKASSEAGYELIKRRYFNKARYPGYVHRVTPGNRPIPGEFEKNEYIFRKTNKSVAVILAQCEPTAYSINNKNYLIPSLLPAIEEDSSDYSEDEISSSEASNSNGANKKEMLMPMFNEIPTTLPPQINEWITLLKSHDYARIQTKLTRPAPFEVNYKIEQKWEHDVDTSTRSVLGSGFKSFTLAHVAIDELNLETMRNFLEVTEISPDTLYHYEDRQSESEVGFTGGHGVTHPPKTEVKEYTLIEYACFKNKVDMACLFIEKELGTFNEKNITAAQHHRILIEHKNKVEFEKIKQENAQLKVSNKKLTMIKNDMESYITYRTGIKLSAESLPKKQSILKGFFAKSKTRSIKKKIKIELEKILPDHFKKLAEQGKYQEIGELAEAMRKEKYHIVNRSLQSKPELNYKIGNTEIKY